MDNMAAWQLGIYCGLIRRSYRGHSRKRYLGESVEALLQLGEDGTIKIRLRTQSRQGWI